MEYQVQLKQHVRQQGKKYKVIYITDIALHTSSKKPTPLGKKLRESFESKEPSRLYGAVKYDKSSPENELVLLDLMKQDPELIKLVQEEEEKGYTVVLAIPHSLPVIAGKDTIEFMNSVNGKRLLRGLAKKNESV